ncbi:unnamed protein product [Arctogadus glacialis]
MPRHPPPAPPPPTSGLEFFQASGSSNLQVCRSSKRLEIFQALGSSAPPEGPGDLPGVLEVLQAWVDSDLQAVWRSSRHWAPQRLLKAREILQALGSSAPPEGPGDPPGVGLLSAS